MGRTKSFDVDEVLDRAVDLFWRRGYAGTSMEDLVQHLGINRGSLYSTFGSKDDLYERAIRRYLGGSIARLTSDLASDAPLKERVRHILVMSSTSPDRRGCLMVNTSAERNCEDDASLTITSEGMAEIRDLFITSFTEADAASDAPVFVPGITAEVAADQVLTVMQGLRVLTTMTGTQPSIDNSITVTLDTLFA